MRVAQGAFIEGIEARMQAEMQKMKVLKSMVSRVQETLTSKELKIVELELTVMELQREGIKGGRGGVTVTTGVPQQGNSGREMQEGGGGGVLVQQKAQERVRIAQGPPQGQAVMVPIVTQPWTEEDICRLLWDGVEPDAGGSLGNIGALGSGAQGGTTFRSPL